MPPPPSVFNQGVKVTPVPAWALMPSPRNYNPSIAVLGTRRVLAYRSHRMDQGGRCGIALCDLDAKGVPKKGTNRWVEFPEQVSSATVHHEDPRLFLFRGRLHLAYTESVFHPAPQPYTCTIKYARLKPKGRGWVVERAFQPRYGRNDGSHQEKNWMFFEARPGQLWFIYRGEPHEVVRLDRDGESVIEVVKESSGVRWPWGDIRGGTPPVKLKDGRWLTIFHSSTAYPHPPHWRRYYAGAYVFEPEAPFRITAISQRPILTGSEADGHGHDPRDFTSWKPFVVFPGGAIPKGKDAWQVAYGVNDYMTVVAEHTLADLALGDPTFANWGPKFFYTENGSLPLKIFHREDQPAEIVPWERAKPRVPTTSAGVLEVRSPRIALHLREEVPAAEEITAEEYQQVLIPR